MALAFLKKSDIGIESRTKQNLSKVTLVTLLLRAISSFEGVMLLSERGMLVEARTLTRNVYETAFYTGALVADEAFIGRMVADNAKHRKTLANELINDRAHSDVIGPDVLSQLAQFLMDLEASGQTLDRLISERAAKQAGMGPLYNFFRDLSGDAHPTIQSLNRYTDGQPDMTGFRLAPDDACVHLALAHAVPAMYACIMPLQPIFQAQAVFDKVTEHFRWFKDYRA
jgi:hypothetical protein